ncbi:TRAP transporter large permease [Mammaliicoccus lentus]|uniref:TRAP transporter large permease n=1 Tax=Mammaliicoccus lentus TaxID=42858 RepID=UPI001E4E1C47|nr:TRAP transporter large permease [Mammaliicoccus lentus]MCD2478874.1 TRAP transporter large permease [Mammaliicoccus lentus]MCD2521906.1 TRAP transporter large permease [Mammaliicoccus lentus]
MILKASLILILLFIFLLAVGIPIAISIAIASLVTILFVLPFDVATFTSAQGMVTSLDSFSLVAIPFFILSGMIMKRGGIATKLVEFAKLLGGRIPGSLAHTNIIGNSLFGAISSSAIAASTAIGGIMVPMQQKEGYDKRFAAAVNVASAPIGMVVPPSTGFIMFSLVSGGTSIAALFISGAVVGVLWALTIMIVTYIIAKKNNFPIPAKKENKNVKKIVFDAIPSILLIVIVIGGILTGLFTAIEASAICVVYSLFLSLIYHRTLKLKELPQIMIEAVEMTGVIMFLIAASSAMSFTMSFIKIPDALSSFVLSISDNPIIILLIINIILLLIGTVMDISPAILIFTPIFLPIVTELGVDPIHYGMFLILNLCIGTITPPVGTGLFVGASVGNVKIEHLIKPLIPFYIAIFILLMIITFVPQISLFLPRFLGL